MNDILKFYIAAIFIANLVVGTFAYLVAPDQIIRHLGIFNFFMFASMAVNLFLSYLNGRD